MTTICKTTNRFVSAILMLPDCERKSLAYIPTGTACKTDWIAIEQNRNDLSATSQLVITCELDDQIKASMQGPLAQVSKQPERHLSLPTELDLASNQTQAANSEVLLDVVCQPGSSSRLHSSGHSQTAASRHLPSNTSQKEEAEDLLSSGTYQTGSGAFSGTTLHPTEPTAVVSSRPQTDESLSSSAMHK